MIEKKCSNRQASAIFSKGNIIIIIPAYICAIAGRRPSFRLMAWTVVSTRVQCGSGTSTRCDISYNFFLPTETSFTFTEINNLLGSDTSINTGINGIVFVLEPLFLSYCSIFLTIL